MKRGKRWLFVTATVLLLGLLGSTDAALPFKKVSIAKTPASTSSTSTTTTEIPESATENEELPQSTGEAEEVKSDNATLSNKPKLTGIPQIDYIWDPNLPRELRGFNLSTYPFLSTVPPMDEIHFKCEGLHDGFYASIEYKCQIYHHCVYGIRHDFLCANFTSFNQKTFICQFASDVDCEGSQKYWNRNDELYMATTTSSTSTTTTQAPPPAPPRRRAQRPYRRPYNRRPVDDYYYEEDELEDDYYEERLNRRNKQRPRQRKPQVQLDYDDEYEDKRVEEKPLRRNRNRYRDDDELSDEDYDDRRNRPSSRRGKPTPAAAGGGRGKASPRKPGRVDERRSFNEERAIEEPRRVAGRRRSNEKRTTPSTTAVLDELDEYEKPYELDQEEAAEEQTPQKVKTTPKPLAEFITPKAAPASVYARPRAPPRIARPVPVNEKKKYSYPVQKNTATAQPPAAGELDDDDYYQDREQQPQQQEDDYEQPPQPVRNTPRRRTAAPREQKPTRSTLRKPVTDRKALVDEQDYYEAERQETQRRKRPQAIRARAPAADVDFVDDVDYEERPSPAPARSQRVRTKATAGPTTRKPAPRPRKPIVQEQEEEQLEPASGEQSEQPRVPPARTKSSLVGVSPERRNQKIALANRQRALPTSKTTPAPALEEEAQAEEEPLPVENDETLPEETDEPLAPAAPPKPLRTASVRVVKRPFLPSRGGSPYLPRGLQPVGVAVRPQLNSEMRTTESTPIDMGSTISGVRLLEHGAPLLRGQQPSSDSDSDSDIDSDELPALAPSPNPPRTTLPPRSALPTAVTPRRAEPQQVKLNLDELYENDYDVTLNDALDPTLKPLTPQHPHQHPNQNQHQLTQQHASYQSRPYASAYAAPVSSGAYNPFAGHGNSYQQASIYQNHSPSSSIASASQSQLPSQSQSQLPSQSQSQPANYHSDSYFSSTDIRRRAIVPAQVTRSNRHEYAPGGAVSNTQVGTRHAQHFYDEFAY